MTIEDIFNKYDMNINKVLGFKEFKGFFDCIGKKLTQQQFSNEYINKFQSTSKNSLSGEEGLTLAGFKEFFID